jgi:hypothetical protein
MSKSGILEPTIKMNPMETNALFDAVKATLEDLSMKFEARPEEGRFRLLVEGKGGFWDTHIHCEQDPAFVHVICVSPAKPIA